MKEVKKILGIRDDLKVTRIEEKIVNKQKYKDIYIESKKNKVRCPECNNFTKSIHDRLKPMKLKGLKIFEVPTNLIVKKRRFICHKCNKKFTEELNINGKKSSISNDLIKKVLKDLRDYNKSIKSIGIENGIDDVTVRNILTESMEGYPEHVKNLPRVISFDEFKADTNEGKYAFVLNDPIHKKVLDILPSRKKERLIQYFTNCENRHSVEVVISDMYEPYLLVTQIMFPRAIFVVDPFHYTKYVMEAIDKIRIRLQKDYGFNSKEYKILKNKKNVGLIRKYSNEVDWWTYTQRYKNGHLIDVLRYDLKQEILNISPELRKGYELKEEFLDIINHATYEDCRVQFLNWIDLCINSNIPEFIDAAKTINNWLEYICNSFIDERYSNGFTEGMNNKIKVIKRVGFGFRNFEFFRLRLLYILNGKISGRKKQKSEKMQK